MHTHIHTHTHTYRNTYPHHHVSLSALSLPPSLLCLNIIFYSIYLSQHLFLIYLKWWGFWYTLTVKCKCWQFQQRSKELCLVCLVGAVTTHTHVDDLSLCDVCVVVADHADVELSLFLQICRCVLSLLFCFMIPAALFIVCFAFSAHLFWPSTCVKELWDSGFVLVTTIYLFNEMSPLLLRI